MKKILSLTMALLLLFGLAACGGAASSSAAPPAASSSAAASNSAAASTPATSDAWSTEKRVGATTGFEYEMIPFLADYDDLRYEEEINVLYLVCTTLAEYFINSFAVWEPYLKERNIKMDLLGPPNYTDESLLNTLESSLAARKYDVILLYPITPSAITPVLETAWNDYKTPIVGYAFAPSTGCGHYYMGTSYYQAGVVLGESILEYVDANAAYYDTLETIPVAVFKNSAGAEQYQRIVGALDVLKKDGRFSVIDEYEANGEAACLAATETLLTNHPEVEVLLTQIDNDVTGAYQAATSGTYKCSEYLSMWGFDATGAVCSQMLKDGKDGFVQGSSFINHETAGAAIVEFIPIIVGATKKDMLIEFKPDEYERLGQLLAEYYTTVTPGNVSKYYKP